MFGHRKLRAENARLHAELRKTVDQLDDARRELHTARQVQRFQIDQRNAAQNDAKRVHGRNQALRQENEDLREQAATLRSRSALVDLDGEYEVLFDRLRRALRGCARYRQQLAEPAPAQGPGLLTELRRSEETRRKLDAQLAVYERRQWPRHTPPAAAPVQPAATPSGLLPSLRKGASS